jgi:hypothetical protein
MVAIHRHEGPLPHPLRLRAADAPIFEIARADALPEHTDYRDTGCELAPSCLSCPLARCRYDEPANLRRLRADRRDREIAYLRRKHRVPIKTIASAYGLTRRSIFRILREQEEHTGRNDP